MQKFAFSFLAFAVTLGLSTSPSLAKNGALFIHAHHHGGSGHTPIPFHGHHGHGLGGSEGTGTAQGTQCGGGFVNLAAISACSTHFNSAGLFVSNSNVGTEAGVQFTNLGGVPFSSFTYETDDGCNANLQVSFTGTRGGTPTTVQVCSCDASQQSGCAGTVWVFSTSSVPELSGLNITKINAILYGNNDFTNALLYNFELNADPVGTTVNMSPLNCPSVPIPSNDCFS